MTEGRWVTVDPERLAGWLERFTGRHGGVEVTGTPDEVLLRGVDGAEARCRVPFPPLPAPGVDPCGGLVTHALVVRRVGVLLARLGGHAVGVFRGAELEASMVGSRPVHGRSAAGGWSQQRFARRREGQVRVAHTAAADAAAAVLVPRVAQLDAIVLGGDRRAVTAVLADPRLAPLRPLVVEPLLDLPDPRRRVLLQAGRQLRAVRIRVTDSDPEPAPGGPV